jgi:hypothetical protein
MVGGSVNDSEDVWVKGPEKMSADFIYLINNDSFKTVYSALIRTIKKRRYHYDVRRVKGKITGKAFRDDMKCFLGYTYEALVPQDFVSCPAHLLRVADIMLNPKFVKLVAWYGLLQPRRGPHG